MQHQIEISRLPIHTASSSQLKPRVRDSIGSHLDTDWWSITFYAPHFPSEMKVCHVEWLFNVSSLGDIWMCVSPTRRGQEELYRPRVVNELGVSK